MDARMRYTAIIIIIAIIISVIIIIIIIIIRLEKKRQLVKSMPSLVVLKAPLLLEESSE